MNASNEIDPAPMIHAILEDLHRGVPVSTISARFHESIAKMVAKTCGYLRTTYGLNQVALSGGVWQNITLLRQTVSQLEQSEFEVLLHKQIPANDGGLALGQAVIASSHLQQARS
jgi:hydrogenase maturation protein HypF